MDAIEKAAFVSVGRACGFAALAIFCTMVGFSYEPITAARVGGTLTAIMTSILAWRALYAPSRNYRRTETWLMLEVDQRPTGEAACQRAIGLALKAAYSWYAKNTAIVAVLIWAVAALIPSLTRIAT